ncbi:hypothetical protein PM082_010133 [Marasmius tenuissimus]|nr:hypothetical protein PM082_010133 [Marasmius tenuissimus]
MDHEAGPKSEFTDFTAQQVTYQQFKEVYERIAPGKVNPIIQELEAYSHLLLEITSKFQVQDVHSHAVIEPISQGNDTLTGNFMLEPVTLPEEELWSCGLNSSSSFSKKERGVKVVPIM